jgi:MoxR-like ATPase
VREQLRAHPISLLKPAVSLAEVDELRTAVQDVYIDEIVQRWIVRLVRATREVDSVAIGASVRGSLALERAARAWALLSGRTYVTPADVERLFIPVLFHRIVFAPSFLAEARATGWQAAADTFREQCLELAPRPGDDLEAEAFGAAAGE